MNPWMTYIVDQIMFVKGLLEMMVVLFIPLVFLFCAGALFEIDNEKEQKLMIKRGMYVITAMIVMLILDTLIPSRDLCIAMMLEVMK